VLPLIGGVLGVALGELDVLADKSIHLPSAWSYWSSTASTVLSTIVGAMAALTGFVVTVTVLVVQMATGNFSARYMRLFYRDRMLKALLALLVGTLAFSFSLLRRVGASAELPGRRLSPGRRFCTRRGDRGESSGLVVPIRHWEDYLTLAVTEIRECGAGSIQIMRRMRAMLEELRDEVRPEHRAAVKEELRRLQGTVTRSFGDSADLDRAGIADAQGIGGRTEPSSNRAISS
jgi:uncharacterized membrane protein